MYDWYSHSGQGARAHEEFHYDKAKSTDKYQYVTFPSSSATGKPMSSYGLVDKQNGDIIDIVVQPTAQERHYLEQEANENNPDYDYTMTDKPNHLIQKDKTNLKVQCSQERKKMNDLN
ncbi:hypothetical protein [Staphylococcus pettenkoferi]|uniref:hypothetical protein n=1 Tax=Staphylococcus pettenkoferi TaxID=170573 RepID=UPI0011A0B511|nr:hypothetical protein [Staphylococcus pettenkoferi]